MVISKAPCPHFTQVPSVPERSNLTLPTSISGPPDNSGAWTWQLWRRMRSHLGLKTIGIALFMWIFFAAYFHLLRNPAFPLTPMPLTALDRAIPFQPSALAAYVSLWLYVGIAPNLLLSLRQLIEYGLWVGGLCVAGLACFYFVPTAVPPVALNLDLAQHPAFALLQGADAAGNACPSLHVATAMFSAFWIDRLLRDVGTPNVLRVLNGGWFLLIVHSTLAIKQHVVLDVLAGGALGCVFALASLRWRSLH